MVTVAPCPAPRLSATIDPPWPLTICLATVSPMPARPLLEKPMRVTSDAHGLSGHHVRRPRGRVAGARLDGAVALEPPLEQLDVDGHRVERIAHLVRHGGGEVLQLSRGGPHQRFPSMPYSASLL